MCINCDSVRSIDERAELSCLFNNLHTILGWVQIFHLVKPSLKDLNLSTGIKSWAVVASSSWSEKTLTMFRMLFQMTIKTVRVSGSNLDSSMQNY